MKKPTPQEWLSQNKGKGLNDYYNHMRKLESGQVDRKLSTEAREELKAQNGETAKERMVYVEKEKPKYEHDKSNSEEKKKQDVLFYIINSIGLISFFMPWYRISFQGIGGENVNGYDLSKYGDAFGSITQIFGKDSGMISGEWPVTMFELILIVPFVFGLNMVFRYLDKIEYITYTSLIGLVVLIFFLVELHLGKLFEISSIGLGCIVSIACMVIVTGKSFSN